MGLVSSNDCILTSHLDGKCCIYFITVFLIMLYRGAIVFFICIVYVCTHGCERENGVHMPIFKYRSQMRMSGICLYLHSVLLPWDTEPRLSFLAILGN